MNKLYITLKDLTNYMNHDEVKQVGPILLIFGYVGLFLTLLLSMPIIIMWVLLIAIYIPFYFIDILLIKRKNNDKNN